MRDLSYRNRRRRLKTASRKRRAERLESFVKGYPRPYSDTGRYTKRHYTSRHGYSGATYYKRKSRRTVRHSDEAYRNSDYRKVFDLWWTLD